MRLVLAHRPGEALTAARELCVEESAALVRHFRDGREEPWLAGWLAQLVQLHLWVACSCRAAHEQPPMLFVRLAERETYVLARMPDRPPHAHGCAFATAPALASAADSPMPLASLPHLLCRWFGAARLNLLFPYEADDVLSHQYAALREVSKSLSLAPGRRLYDFSRTHPQGLPELFRRLCRAAEEERSDARSVGVYLTVASSLESIEWPQASAHKDGARNHGGAVATPAIDRLPGTEGDGGPFVVIIEYAATRKEAIGVQRVFVQPVYSRRILVPVQCDQERRTLSVLLDVQRSLLSGHQRLISIRKTLPDAPIYERGIAFQVQQLGPNGRASFTFDILSADAGLAHHEGVTLEAGCETLYHRVGPTQGPSAPTDLSFRRTLISYLLREAQGRPAPKPEHVPTLAS